MQATQLVKDRYN